jgi:hypothetical protein
MSDHMMSTIKCPKVFLLTFLSLYYKLCSTEPSPSTQPLLAVDSVPKMPRPKLSEEEYRLRRKAARKKWECKVGIRQESPPPLVLAHRPVTRSMSAESQPAIQEGLSTLLEPIRPPIAPVQSQSTSLQEEREDSFVPALDDNDDDFNNLGGDADYPFDSGFIPGDEGDPSEDEEPPSDEALGSSHPHNHISAASEQSSSDSESDIETSTTRKGKEKALPMIQESSTSESRPTRRSQGDDAPSNHSLDDDEDFEQAEGTDPKDIWSRQSYRFPSEHKGSEEEGLAASGPATFRRPDNDEDPDIIPRDIDDKGEDSEIEVIDEEDDEALLAAQLQAEGRPGVNIPQGFAQQLISFHGCSHERHQDNQQPAHILSPTHCTMKQYATLIRNAVPRVINKPKIMTSIEREKGARPDWRLAFEGIRSHIPSYPPPNRTPDNNDSEDNEGPKPIYICLACSQIDPEYYDITYDWDSKLGFATSLGFGRQGMQFILYPRFCYNLKTNLHIFLVLYHNFERGRKQVKVPVHRVPHIYLGRLLGAEDVEVYILFPEMWDPKKETNFPGKADDQENELIRVWIDKIMIPCLFRVGLGTNRQHWPTSWECAMLRSKAQYAERSTRYPNEEDTAIAKALSSPVPGSELHNLWQHIEAELQKPEFQLYHGAQIFFSSKNTKGHGSYLTMAAAREGLRQVMSYIFDETYIDRTRFWVDLGKETACPVYTLSINELDPESLPTTCLIRTCCQESLAQWALLGEKKDSVKKKLYHVAMLRDATDMTLEMSRLSAKRALGWVFSQSYNSIKESFDAAKSKPFGSEFLCRLAWDVKAAEMIYATGGGKGADLKRVLAGYLNSRRRLWREALAARGISWGSREEHRITLDFLGLVEAEMHNMGEWDQPRSRIAAEYSHVWRLASSDYSRYITWNTNKFLAVIEWIWSLRAEKRIDYEHCKSLTMFLEAIPYAFDSGPIIRSSNLWKVRFEKRKGGKVVLGMGWAPTMQDYGYAWGLPRLDCNTLAFRREFKDDICYATSMLHEAYRKNWKSVKAAKDDYGKLQRAIDWVVHYGDCDEVLRFIQRYIVNLLIRSYRGTIIAKQLKSIRKEFQDDALQGRIAFCYTEIRRIFTPEAWENLWISNCKQTKVQSIEELVNLLWEFNDGRVRKGWENLRFRFLYEEMVYLLIPHLPAHELAQFRDMFKRFFIANSWLIPYSTPTKLFQTNHWKQQIWVGIYHYRLAKHNKLNQEHRVIQMASLIQTVLQDPTHYPPFPRQYPNDHVYYSYPRHIIDGTPEQFIEWSKDWWYKCDEYEINPKIEIPDWDLADSESMPARQRTAAEPSTTSSSKEEDSLLLSDTEWERREFEKRSKLLPRTTAQVKEFFMRKQPLVYRWMRDWDLARRDNTDHESAHMMMVPAEWDNPLLAVDASIADIEEWIETEYRSWEELEGRE